MRQIVRALVLFAFALALHAQAPLEAPPVERFTLPSKIMGEERAISVRVPASYRTTARRYPVLYLTDGEAHLGHSAATIEFLAREGRMPEAIAVAVTNTDRTRDLSPTKDAARAGESGGADRFFDFFEKELIPAIEARYRTAPYRVFAGHSLGGLFAVQGVLTRPKLFDAWIAVSPALQWDQRYPFRRATEFFDPANVTVPKDLATTLVVTIGDEGDDARKNFDDFQKLIAQRAPKGFDATFLHFADEDHGSVVMPSHYAALRKVFAPWRFALGGPNSDPKQELARANTHFASLSKKLGYEILPPENMVNILGYRLLRADRTADAIAVFQQNAKNWPKSANVFDSLGEAYEKAGQRAEARSSYETAVKLGSEVNDPNVPLFRRNAERMK